MQDNVVYEELDLKYKELQKLVDAADNDSEYCQELYRCKDLDDELTKVKTELGEATLLTADNATLRSMAMLHADVKKLWQERDSILAASTQHSTEYDMQLVWLHYIDNLMPRVMELLNSTPTVVDVVVSFPALLSSGPGEGSNVVRPQRERFPTSLVGGGETSAETGINIFLRKARKPYTITKQRERWTDDEHNRFLQALKLYGRAWQRIEEDRNIDPPDLHHTMKALGAIKVAKYRLGGWDCHCGYAVLSVIDPVKPELVDLRDVRIVKKLGGTVDDTELVKGLVFDKKVSHSSGGLTKVENAKVGVIQFQISPPKTDIEQSIVVSDYTQMDRILKEERNYILGMIKKIKATGCNVLLIQKSILRDAVTDLSLYYLAKAKILVVKDVERDDIEFITKTLNYLPIANIGHFREEKLGRADCVEEVSLGDGGKIVKISGIKDMGRTTTVLVRGSNQLVLDEAERSLHDALCVIRCLVNKKFLIAGGGVPEIELSRQLGAWAKVLQGMESYCIMSFAEALEVIPYILAENAGLNMLTIVTELRNRHAQGEIDAGINVRKGQIINILEENVVQPLLVSTSAITLATECVRMILKIDDIVTVR
ncbi:hypothetical protein GIB67_001985 [Kingdonia uniflora]|uniref:T-complex protein 1 subunit delta n=1 Tax=Kingdonia uniflora TaxID=39325 RepID=A0A7J7MA43_9MAGN|nr:hypothetical protein GIB67_001985 [Kingdonia uniflora]